MITISIQPFSSRKLLAIGVAALCASTASCFADAMYLTAPMRQSDSSPRQVSEQRTVGTGTVFIEVAPWAANLRLTTDDAAASVSGAALVSSAATSC